MEPFSFCSKQFTLVASATVLTMPLKKKKAKSAPKFVINKKRKTLWLPLHSSSNKSNGETEERLVDETNENVKKQVENLLVGLTVYR